jgi:(E)-4-hydroxy-3-methylbut-2-enyl-diphosphate synthase
VVSRRETFVVNGIGGHQVPAVIADLSKLPVIQHGDLKYIGYTYNEATDKWNISDAAADFIYTGDNAISFALPGTLNVIQDAVAWERSLVSCADNEAERLFTEKHFPIFEAIDYMAPNTKSSLLNFVMLDSDAPAEHEVLKKLGNDKTVVLCLSSQQKNAVAAVRCQFEKLAEQKVKNPVILIVDSNWQTADEHLIHYATETGALLLDGLGDGICLGMTGKSYNCSSDNSQQTTINASGRNYLQSHSVEQFLNNTAFSILQATRTRISKTEYISCPSCGRTLFDLQETTAKIRAVTHHLKGVKIAIMGCIVNGPGEMADADFGYVGSGPGKITLYKSKDVVKRNVPSEIAVEELVSLLKEHGAWVERPEAALVS